MANVIIKTSANGYFLFMEEKKPKIALLEETEQINAASMLLRFYPGLLWFHTPNESKAAPQYRKKQAKKGVLAGVSDFIILSRGADYPSAAIELKRANGIESDLTEDQKSFLINNIKAGNFSAVAFGAFALVSAIESYLTGIYTD